MDSIYSFTEQHHGVLSRRESVQLGLSPGQLIHQVRRGRLRRVAPNVYVVAGSPDSWHRQARIAALSIAGLVSHNAAAALHGIDGYRLGKLELVVPKDRRPRREEYTIHRTTQFHLTDPVEIDSIPTTGLTRTVIDLAGVTSFARFERTVDAVLRQDLCEWRELFAVLQCHSIQGRNGCGPLRRLLDVRDPQDPIPDSLWNRMVGQLLRAAGLPEPRYEFKIHEPNGSLIGRVDLAYPESRLAIELDSSRWHRNRASFENDPRRKNRLMTAGWTVLSFTWADYADRPHEIIKLVSGFCGRSAARVAHQRPQNPEFG